MGGDRAQSPAAAAPAPPAGHGCRGREEPSPREERDTHPPAPPPGPSARPRFPPAAGPGDDTRSPGRQGRGLPKPPRAPANRPSGGAPARSRARAGGRRDQTGAARRGSPPARHRTWGCRGSRGSRGRGGAGPALKGPGTPPTPHRSALKGQSPGGMLPPGGRSRSLPPPATCRCSWSSARVASALRVQPVGGRRWRVPVSPRWLRGGRARPAFLPQLLVPQPGCSRAGPARVAERTGFAKACGPPLRPSVPVIPKGEQTAWKNKSSSVYSLRKSGKSAKRGLRDVYRLL